MTKEKRTVFFIDGFNMYHSMKEGRYAKYKWLNYWSFSEKFLLKGDILSDVLYFTAIAHWSDKEKRHRPLIAANEDAGVKVIYGKFKRVDRFCRECRKEYKTREEKLTDVNIATHLFLNAIEDKFDKAVIVSGDSDLIPAVNGIQKAFPCKELFSVTPIRRYSQDLVKAIGKNRRVREEHLKTSQFDDMITLKDGRKVFRPKEWQ